jgi:hypothetical protein
MTKRKQPKPKQSDQDVLKHYTPYDRMPSAAKRSGEAAAVDAGKRPVGTTFVKAIVKVDKTLAGRKSAVISTPAATASRRRERTDVEDD